MLPEQCNRIRGADQTEHLIDRVEMIHVVLVADHFAQMAGADGHQTIIGCGTECRTSQGQYRVRDVKNVG